MFSVEMLPARAGDALWLTYGPDAGPYRHVVIDTGVSGTAKALALRTADAMGRKEDIELLVLTHVDGDHVLGAVSLLGDRAVREAFGDIWFNGWRHLPGTTEPMGPVEGEELAAVLGTGKWNVALGGAAVVADGHERLPEICLPGGMKLTVIGPTSAELSGLRAGWVKAVQRAGLVPGGRSELAPLPLSGLEVMGLSTPDVAMLARSTFTEDRAAANGTSITILTEYGGRAALFCGDAWPSVVQRGIERLLGQRRLERLSLSALKLPHHGSRHNLSESLLDRLVCTNYLISTDGTRTSHPHPEAIARVLARRAGVRLCFNYRTAFTEVWGRPDLTERYGYEALYGDGSLRFELPVAPAVASAGTAG